jgi:PAS domain S-box-containing protein
MKGLSTRLYLATGLAFLVASILLAAAFFGLLPDRGAALREGRTALAELAAVTSAAAVDPERVPRVQATLAFMLERNRDLVSIAVRRKDGAIVVSAGDHFAHWQPTADDRSTDTQILVPISANKERWGQLELKFRPTGVPSLFGMEMPWLYLAAYMLFGSLVAFYFYLGRVLRHLDPSQAVPARVRAALDTLAEGLVVIDKKQSIVLANQAFASLLGAASEDLLGKPLAAFGWIAPDGSPLQKDQFPWVAAMRSGTVQRDCLVYLTDAAGKLHMFHANCSPVAGGDGKTGGVLISLDDVTQLEEQKVELRQAQEAADAANRAKSEFLANMSHEIRTPMNAILGFTEVLKRGWGKNEREARRHLDTIHSSGKHLIELINDILDLSKVEAGRMEVERIDCEPHRVLQEVVKVLGVRARDKGITLGLEAAGPVPAKIQSDPGRLRQIVTNLVGNALKFTERGGVRVMMRIAGTPAAPRLAIDVIDTGIGIPEDKIGNLFQAFAQADTSVTRKFGGTGLGLVLSRNFARALGGDIVVTSVAGEGSTFSATIDTGPLAGVRMLQPAEIARAAEHVADEMQTRWEFPASRRVLVVDDGPENRELVSLVLAEAGITVEEAENGQIAVDKATSTAYDAILMDMSMPVMDGYTATKVLRGRGMKVPIIALTAHAMKGFEQEILAAGCTGYVTKPIDIDVLLGALAEKLGGRRVKAAAAAPWAAAPAPATRTTPAPAAAARFAAPASSASQPIPELRDVVAGAAAGPPIVSRLASHPKLRPAIGRFAGRLDEQLTAMDAALTASDFKELAALAHWLKGAGGTVGYDDFTVPARNLETLAKAGDAAGAVAALQEIRGLALRLEAPAEDDAQVAA